METKIDVVVGALVLAAATGLLRTANVLSNVLLLPELLALIALLGTDRQWLLVARIEDDSVGVGSRGISNVRQHLLEVSVLIELALLGDGISELFEGAFLEGSILGEELLWINQNVPFNEALIAGTRRLLVILSSSKLGTVEVQRSGFGTSSFSGFSSKELSFLL